VQAVAPNATQVAAEASEEIRRVEMRLASKTVQAMLEDWSAKLGKQSSEFQQYARSVDDWEHKVHLARAQLDRATTDLYRLREAKTAIQAKISSVTASQGQLEAKLATVERALRDKDAGTGSTTSAGRERRGYYQRATRVDQDLSDLQTQVKALVERLQRQRRTVTSSADGSAAGDRSSAAEEVREVLDAHAADLEWIDQEALSLERKASDIGTVLERRDR
jgi:chromosome segregation ATPase